jgi:putative ABC transport system permease protein
VAFLRTLRIGLRRLLKKDAVEQDLDDEVRDYLARAADEHIRAGMTPAAAARRARAEMGGVESVKEEARGSRTWDGLVETTLRDLRFSARSLARTPAFTFVTAITLALGIGATTAIFSAVKPILFDPLPYPDGGRILTVWYGVGDGTRVPQTFGTYRELVTRTRTLSAVSAMKAWTPTLTPLAAADGAESLVGQRVTASYFGMLGVAPAIGRDFDAAADVPGGADEAIISNGLWRRRFAEDRAIVGRTVRLDDRPFTVVGVMPASFENVLTPAAEIWTLLKYDPSLPLEGREWGHHLRIAARLAPSAGLAAARAEIDQIARTPADNFPRPPWAAMKQGLIVNRLADDVTGAVRSAFTAVMVAVLVMLAIAAVNVANLLVGRTVQRRAEFAMRSALGAGRGRLIRQLLAEAALIAAIGGALGVLVAYLGLGELIALSPPGLPRIAAMRLDPATFLFAAIVTGAMAFIVGIIPAAQVSRGNLFANVQQGGRRVAGAHRATRRCLVIAEVALALILLVNAGLLWRSLSRLFAVDPGFVAADLLTMQVQPPAHAIDKAASDQFYKDALAAVASVPGAGAAAFTAQLPLSGDDDEYGARFEGDDPKLGENVFRYAVSGDYFAAIGLPIRRGRGFAASDTTGGVPVAILSESLAKRRFPDKNPIGQRVHIGPESGPWFAVVGVAGDVRQAALTTEQPDALYIPAEQSWMIEGVRSLVVRATNPAALAPAVKRAIWTVDPTRPILRVATMSELVARTAAERRFVMIVIEAFALVALVLAAIGLHGVLASQVAERMREIGVRAALGASRGAIVRLILGQGFALTLAGLAIGLAGAMLASRTLVTLLFGVTPLDVATYSGVIALLAAVSALACAVPAWRAAHVDPVTTLKAE